jgi:hypothetical protein
MDRGTMLLKHIIVAAICGNTLVSLPAFGQENPMSKADISVEVPVSFVENKNSDGAQQSATVNCGFLGNYRLFFNKHSGVELSYGYAHNIQRDSPDPGSIGVKNNPDEVLATHVFRFPAKRWSPVVLAGAGALIFDPKAVKAVTGASTQTQLGYPNGDSADFDLKRRIFPRTEHRGIFYNSTTVNVGGLNSLDWLTNPVKPALVFGYSF